MKSTKWRKSTIKVKVNELLEANVIELLTHVILKGNMSMKTYGIISMALKDKQV